MLQLPGVMELVPQMDEPDPELLWMVSSTSKVLALGSVPLCSEFVCQCLLGVLQPATLYINSCRAVHLLMVAMVLRSKAVPGCACQCGLATNTPVMSWLVITGESACWCPTGKAAAATAAAAGAAI
jgi:hypothetical protein